MPFLATEDGIEATFSDDVRAFLGDVVPMLAAVGDSEGDAAARRLQVPVYRDDEAANDEWWRLMGPDLDAARRADRRIFQRVIESDEPVTLSDDEADAFLRVLNEARLALGARMGVEVEEDYDDLPEHSRNVLVYLGIILEELTEALSSRF